MKKTILLAVALIVIIAAASVFYNNYQENNPSQSGSSGSDLEQQKEENQYINSSDSANAENPGSANSESENSNSDTSSDSDVISAMDFTVYNQAEETVKLSDFYGKPIIVNFWATWCGPCKSELPAFENIYNEYGEDITFMMVNLTDGVHETISGVSEFVGDNNYHFPVYFDTDSNAALTYGVFSIPATLFIDADGNIVASHLGAMSEDTLRTYINNLLIAE